VHLVETTLNEGALTPADDLLPQPDLRGHAGHAEAPEAERVEQSGIAADEIFGIVRQRRAVSVAVHDLEIVQAVGTHEDATAVLVVHGQLSNALEHLAVHRAAEVVEVAVIDVRRVAAAAIGAGDQAAVGLADAPTLTIPDG